MQRLYGYVRKACQDFDMIQDGDKIAVGISGGKDSVVLLQALAGFRRFSEHPFELYALTIDPQFGGIPTDYSPIERMCEKLGVPYNLIRSDIGQVVFDIRKEDHPCALCAKMRRGALHDATRAMGCGKLALGHHMDDTVETFFMNLFNEGRIGCYAPVSYLSRKDITVIRPLVLAPEKEISSCCRRMGFEIVESACPADKTTSRQDTKDWLTEMERSDKGFKARIFGALRRSGINGWGFPERTDKDEL